MNNSFNYPTKYRIPQNGNLLYNKITLNYTKDRYEINNSIKEYENKKTSLYYCPNCTIPSVKDNKENYLLILNNNNERRRNKSPCFCNCHKYKYKYNFIFQGPYKTEFSNSFYAKKDKLNNDLLFKVNKLNNSLQIFEDKLNKIKNEKKISDCYIKKLENDFTFLNGNKYLINDAHKVREKELLKLKYKNNDINKSLNNFDNIKIKSQNKIINEKNSNHIEDQKKRLDRTYGSQQIINIDKNYLSKKIYDNNNEINFNYKYYKNFYDLNNKSKTNNNDNKLDNLYKKDDINFQINNLIGNNFNNNINNKKEKDNKSNIINSIKEMEYKPGNIEQIINTKNNIKNNISNKNDIYYLNKFELTGLSPNNQNIIKNYENIEENTHKKNNSFYERYIILDKNGNPIFINGERLLGIKLKELDEDKKNKSNNKKNQISCSKNNEINNIGILQPIILNNGKPLVNEENKPFLGIDNKFIIKKDGNPIVGQIELYGKNKQKILGELGVLPRDIQGNIIKIKIKADYAKNKKNNYFTDNEYIKNIQLQKYINKNEGNKGINIIYRNNLSNNKIKKEEKAKKYYPDLIKIKYNLQKTINKSNSFNYKNKYIPFKYIQNKNKEISSSCFACDIGCGVSRSGYSTMTYSPFNNKKKREEETPLKMEKNIHNINNIKNIKILK